MKHANVRLSCNLYASRENSASAAWIIRLGYWIRRFRLYPVFLFIISARIVQDERRFEQFPLIFSVFPRAESNPDEFFSEPARYFRDAERSDSVALAAT